MADSVIIEQLGPNVNEWATEKTAESILSALIDNNKISKEDVKWL